MDRSDKDAKLLRLERVIGIIANAYRAFKVARAIVGLLGQSMEEEEREIVGHIEDIELHMTAISAVLDEIGDQLVGED